jgi:hypothetical protein
MISLRSLLAKLNIFSDRRGIRNALAHSGEVRDDGLTLVRASHRLEIEWRAREIHPWDRFSKQPERVFTEQAISDTDATLSRLFDELPEVDVIEFAVLHPANDHRILAGKVERTDRVPDTRGLSPRTRLWHRGVTTMIG